MTTTEAVKKMKMMMTKTTNTMKMKKMTMKRMIMKKKMTIIDLMIPFYYSPK